ncbi:hypothetical protein AKO1_007839 [Acrasis kona]|uniref:Uncharacterized protein n=1 Tax=Acrasis kona TaxID=1008807 RepID=A0AAW2YPI3_9EUKA
MSLPRTVYSNEQSGVVQIGKCSKQKGHVVFNVIFDHPFNSSPIVHLTPINDHKGEDFTIATCILSTTRTGFCAVARRVSNRMSHRGWNCVLKVNWFASPVSAFNAQHIIGPSIVNNVVVSNTTLGRQVVMSTTNQDYYATAIVRMPITEQHIHTTPNIIVTTHAGDSSADDTFICSIREIYPDRFVAIIRKASDDSTKTWTQCIKLNWTAVYPNVTHLNNDLFKCKIVPVGDNSVDADCAPRNISFVHRKPLNIDGTVNETAVPSCVIVMARHDPTRPCNETFCFTVQHVTSNGFRLLIRNFNHVTWTRGWGQNLYLTYLVHYKRQEQKKKRLILSPSTDNLSAFAYPAPVVPTMEQVHITNCANGLVLDIPEYKKNVKVQLWSQKIFITSHNQRFILTDDGFLECATDRAFVLECKDASDGQEVIMNLKDKGNILQRWVVFRPPVASPTLNVPTAMVRSPSLTGIAGNGVSSPEVYISCSANLKLVLDCDYSVEESLNMQQEAQNAKGTVVFVSQFNASKKSQLWQFKSAENRIGI